MPNLEIRKDEIQLILNDMAEAFAMTDPTEANLPAETSPEDMETLASTIKEANASLEWTAYSYPGAEEGERVCQPTLQVGLQNHNILKWAVNGTKFLFETSWDFKTRRDYEKWLDEERPEPMTQPRFGTVRGEAPDPNTTYDERDDGSSSIRMKVCGLPAMVWDHPTNIHSVINKITESLSAQTTNISFDTRWDEQDETSILSMNHS